MRSKEMFRVVLATLLLFSVMSAFAQESTDDPADVWSVIEQKWNFDEKGDKKWPDRQLTEDFAGWEKESPAPRDKASTTMWNRVDSQLGKTIAHELYPLSITVHEDVAVAHYLYRNIYQPKNDELTLSNGRYTDVLVRTPEGWKFLAWHGGAD